MVKTMTAADRVNAHLRSAQQYIRIHGWQRGGLADYGQPADVRDAIILGADRDGYELVAYRLMARQGFDIAWNDLICANKFEAVQALDRTFTNDDIAYTYGPNWYGCVGLLRMLTATRDELRHILSAHIGPADVQVINAVRERFEGNPIFEDVLFVGTKNEGPMCEPVRWMCWALAANVLYGTTPPDDLAHIVAPIAIKLGLA